MDLVFRVRAVGPSFGYFTVVFVGGGLVDEPDDIVTDGVGDLFLDVGPGCFCGPGLPDWVGPLTDMFGFLGAKTTAGAISPTILNTVLHRKATSTSG